MTDDNLWPLPLRRHDLDDAPEPDVPEGQATRRAVAGQVAADAADSEAGTGSSSARR